MKINGATRTITPQSPENVAGGTKISRGTDGNYTIDLSNKNNKVDLSQNKDGSWNISIDGKAKLSLSAKEMENLTINGNGGDDVFNVKNGDLTKSVTFNGGDGNDTVKLGFDPIKNTVVDKDKVNFNPGKRVGDVDTFEYVTKGKVTAGAGEALPSKVFTKTTEVYK
jgi:hypothetical protein